MIENLRLSLSDLLGADYTRAVCEARALLTGENPEALRALSLIHISPAARGGGLCARPRPRRAGGGCPWPLPPPVRGAETAVFRRGTGLKEASQCKLKTNPASACWR